MRTRLLNVGVLLVASAAVLGTEVGAQGVGGTHEVPGRCVTTPVTITGVAFEVASDGPTERLLRAVRPLPPRRASHAPTHEVAMGREHVSPVRLHHPKPGSPLLMTPRVGADTPAPVHHHHSVFSLLPTEGGSTGCRLRLRPGR